MQRSPPPQESERLNVLLVEMKRSLVELDLGLKGGLTMSGPMEAMMTCLAGDTVPASWRKASSPSLRGLASWFVNLLARHAQLLEWTTDLTVPKSVWLSGEHIRPYKPYLTALFHLPGWSRTADGRTVAPPLPKNTGGCLFHPLLRWVDVDC